MMLPQYDWDWNRERFKKLYCDEDIKKSALANRQSLDLKFSDSGKLFNLLSTLYDDTCPYIEMKINKYLREATGVKVVFFIHDVPIPQCFEVLAINDHELIPSLIIEESEPFAQRLRKCPNLTFTDKADHLAKSLLAHVTARLKASSPNPKFRNMLLSKIELEHGGTPLFVALVNFKETLTSKQRNSRIVSDCIRFCGALVANTYTQDQENKHVYMCQNVIEAAIDVFAAIRNEAELAEAMKRQTKRIFKTDQVQVYFFENFSGKQDIHAYDGSKMVDHLSLEKNKDSPFVVPFQMVNSGAENIENTLSFLVKKDFRFEVKNLLQFPLLFKDEQTGGIETYNKTGGFDLFDKQYAHCLSYLYGLAIRVFMFITRFERSITRQRFLKTTGLERIPLDYIDVSNVMNCTDNHFYCHITEFKFRPSLVPDEHTVCVLMAMMSELGLIESLTLDEDALVRPLEAFGLIVAAVVHDMDYLGATTGYQITAGTALGTLYSTPGCTHKRLIFYETILLLSTPNLNITENMTNDQFKNFIELLDYLITETDLSSFLKKIYRVERMVDKKYDLRERASVSLLLSLLMTSASISDCCKPWTYHLEMITLLANEFMRTENLKFTNAVIDFSDFKMKEKKVIEMHIQYLEVVCLPIFEYLQTLFPITHICYSRIESNRDRWAELLDDLRDKKSEVVTPTSGSVEDFQA